MLGAVAPLRRRGGRRRADREARASRSRRSAIGDPTPSARTGSDRSSTSARVRATTRTTSTSCAGRRRACCRGRPPAARRRSRARLLRRSRRSPRRRSTHPLWQRGDVPADPDAASRRAICDEGMRLANDSDSGSPPASTAAPDEVARGSTTTSRPASPTRTARRARPPAPGRATSRSAAGKARARPARRSPRSTTCRSTCASSRRRSWSEAMKNPSHPHGAARPQGARRMLERDSRVVSPSYPRDYPFVMSHGRGAEVWDVDGNRFLDFVAGIAVCATGHCASAGRRRRSRTRPTDSCTSPATTGTRSRSRLGERLAAIARCGEPAMSFFCQSGTEAVEGALKLARYVTGRGRFIGFLGGFHGRTMGSLAFTSSKYTQQKGFFPTMPGVTHVPYPNPVPAAVRGRRPGRGGARLHRARAVQAQRAADAKSPRSWSSRSRARAATWCRRDGFLPGLRALCDRHGILLIFDEVQSGIGRTGQDVRVRALGRRARHPDARQGPGLGPADRRWWSRRRA